MLCVDAPVIASSVHAAFHSCPLQRVIAVLLLALQSLSFTISNATLVIGIANLVSGLVNMLDCQVYASLSLSISLSVSLMTHTHSNVRLIVGRKFFKATRGAG